MRYLLAAMALVTAGVPCAVAQGPQSSAVRPLMVGSREDSTVTSTIHREPGVLVEVAGLKRWTIPMIQDSLAVHEPGLPFYRKDCRDALQRQFPIFPQSVVIQNGGDSAVVVFLALVEPQDVGLLTVRKFTGDPLRTVAPWRGLPNLTRTRFGSVRNAMVISVDARATGLTPAVTRAMRADSVEFTQVWKVLAAHDTPKDLAAARQILRTSPNAYDRLAAIVVLSNFDGDDTAWHALAGALLDPKDLVREYARAALHAFAINFARSVDWRPAATDIHALLQGSDLWSLPETLDMLVATGVDSRVASPFLKNGGHALLLFAGAQNDWARTPAFRFLHAVSDQDLGGNPERWRAWIATL